MAGTAEQVPGITVTAGAEGWEIVNERVGIRVPKTPTDLTKTPAPIQGLRFQDGTWTAVGPNFMPRPAKAMAVEFLEQGPLVVIVKVSYIYDKGPLHSHLNRPEFPDVPGVRGRTARPSKSRPASRRCSSTKSARWISPTRWISLRA